MHVTSNDEIQQPISYQRTMASQIVTIIVEMSYLSYLFLFVSVSSDIGLA